MNGKTPIVIGFTNQKGGVGKTVTTISTATLLREQGYKVLVIDADPQCNTTVTLRGEYDEVATLYDLLVSDDTCAVKEAIQKTVYMDIIAGDPHLTDEDAEQRLANRIDKYSIFKKILRLLPEDYDYVLIDTNPSLNTLLRCVMACCQYLVVPCQAKEYALQGLGQLSSTILDIKAEINPEISYLGILPVDYMGRAIVYQHALLAMERIANQMDIKMFKPIRHAAVVEESCACKIPLLAYAPQSNPMKDYRKFVDELLQMIREESL